MRKNCTCGRAHGCENKLYARATTAVITNGAQQRELQLFLTDDLCQCPQFSSIEKVLFTFLLKIIPLKSTVIYLFDKGKSAIS